MAAYALAPLGDEPEARTLAAIVVLGATGLCVTIEKVRGMCAHGCKCASLRCGVNNGVCAQENADYRAKQAAVHAEETTVTVQRGKDAVGVYQKGLGRLMKQDIDYIIPVCVFDTANSECVPV